MVILRNLAHARWRARIKLAELEEDSACVQPVAESRLVVDTLCRAIDRLPPEQAAVMRLVLAGEVSPQVIAQRLRLPPGTVMSRLARARASLRATMGMGARAHVSELL